MEIGVILFTLGAYGLAGYLSWQERAPHYVVALLGGHLAALASPLWQALYGFSYDPSLPALYTWQRSEEIAYTLPRAIFLAAWTAALPPLVIFYLYRRRLWFASYLTTMLTFALFVLYHLLVESIG